MTRWVKISLAVLLLLSPLAQPARAAAVDRAAQTVAALPAGGTVGNGTSGSCDDTEFKTKVAGGGLVTFNCGGPKTIVITGPITITQNTTITGGGVITLTGNSHPRLFTVNGGSALTLNGLVLDDFYGAGGDGGALVNHGTLTINDSLLQNNRTDNAHVGGAIYTNGPALNIANSFFKNNHAGAAGAIYALGGAVTISNSRFDNNYTTASEGHGGALYIATDATLHFTDGLLLGNKAVVGGGLYIDRDAVVTLESTDKSHPPCPPLAQASLTNAPAACAQSPQFEGQPNFNTLQFANNKAEVAGGGIYNGGGRLTANSLTLFQNTVPITLETYGGGIANYGTLDLINSFVNYNQAAYGGGVAVMPNAGSGLDYAQIDDGYFYGNHAGQGGALYTSAPTMAVTATDTLFMQNEADTAGGGVFRYDTLLTINRSSFNFNTAAIGPAILNSTDTVVANSGNWSLIRDTTVSSNSATFLPGAIFNADLLEILSVTIVGNSAGVYTSSDGQTNMHSTVLQNALANCSGDHAPVDTGFNYATDVSCAFTLSTQGNGLDPLLGPLTFNLSNRTYFHLPQPGSPLIDADSPNCAVLDQRGFLRLNACDIGAVETDARPPLTYLPLVRR